MARVTFDKVSIKGVRRWIEDGKKRQETREFFQTLNPFNKAADGTPKSRTQIVDEIRRERTEWLADSSPPGSGKD